MTFHRVEGNDVIDTDLLELCGDRLVQLRPIVAVDVAPQRRHAVEVSMARGVDELVALAKHYPNVYADLCWAWSVDPYSSCDFVRQMIHAVPSNKLFAFGGDTMWPNSALAYSIQSRQWLARALKGEVDDCLLSEAEAIKLATRLMATNQEECFDLTGTRTAITETLSVATA